MCAALLRSLSQTRDDVGGNVREIRYLSAGGPHIEPWRSIYRGCGQDTVEISKHARVERTSQGGVSMRLSIFFGMLLLLASLRGIGIAEEQQDPENLIRREMIAIDSAFKITIDAMVLNEPGRIVSAFDEVNRTREQIELALKQKTKITLPRNQKRFREFVRLDNKFHHEVQILLMAAKKNKMGVIQKQTHLLLNACVRCHTIFRK